MKYKTIVELICEGMNADDASYTAGEYLRGRVDYGVEMRCKTESLTMHRVKKYVAISVAAFIVCTIAIPKVITSGTANDVSKSGKIGLASTFTIVPKLKTQSTASFKNEWQEKKEEAVLDYIKK